MVTRSILRYIRITPRKFRLIIPLVKGKTPEQAMAILAGVKKGAARYCEDLLHTAVADTKRIQGLDASTLYISKLVADGGPMLKRFRADSMGRASQILKRTSHMTLELDTMTKPVSKTEVVHEKTKKIKETGGAEEKVKVKSKKAKVQLKSKKFKNF